MYRCSYITENGKPSEETFNINSEYVDFRNSQVKIQTKVRAYFTRKWYVNLQVRKKLSVPFSGMEFAQNPFLRQFNKIN